MYWISLVSSFLITAFGQPAWIPGLGMAASFFGFALFWHAMLQLPRGRDRFWLSTFWYFLVHGVQLSWMTSAEYMGPYIYGVYLFLIFGVGVQFGILSFFIKRPFCLRQLLGVAGLWVILEWLRLYFLSGFTWNPAGLSLADSQYAIQWAAVFGIYGLSFWVILVNMAALRAFIEKKGWALWGTLALFPYAFGWIHQTVIEWKYPLSKSLSIALVQTALLPEQKDYWKSRSHSFIPPLDQWERILDFLNTDKKLDLIVLPEAAFPLGAYRNFYPIELVKGLWIHYFGIESLADLPPLIPPYGQKTSVNNLFLAQALANHYKAHVIVGLDAIDRDAKYNAAFHFQPEGTSPCRYEKRVLVPVGEYKPLREWTWISNFLTREFGIGDTFDPGTKVTIFQGPMPIGITICLEEIYSDLTRKLRLKGAELFINVSNDVWFPNSLLSEQHFEHGRVRTVENGVYTFRAGNTGVTGVIDCFGRLLSRLPASEHQADVLFLTLPIRNYPTIYTLWGDWAILGISVSSLLFLLVRKKKLP